MSLRALIFDVDGTLADTEEAHRQAFNAAFAAHGVGWNWGREAYAELLKVPGGKERIAHFIAGLDVPPSEKTRLTALVPALHAAKTSGYVALVAEGGAPLRPGVERLLGEARMAGLKLAIATTTSPANIEALVMRALGAGAMGWFDAIAAGDQVPRKKPAPDVYLLALERLNLPAADAMAFEDSAIGVRAAKGASLYTVATPSYWTAADDLSAADVRLDDLAAAGGLEALRARHARWREGQGEGT